MAIAHLLNVSLVVNIHFTSNSTKIKMQRDGREQKHAMHLPMRRRSGKPIVFGHTQSIRIIAVR